MFRKLFDKTFLRFMAVGVINTIVGSGLQFLLYNVFFWPYWPATAANYIVGSVVSFLLNKHFTFRVKDSSLKTVLLFAGEIACCYLIAYGAAKPLTRWLLTGTPVAAQENIAMLVGMGIFVVLNYLGQRFIVFRKR